MTSNGEVVFEYRAETDGDGQQWRVFRTATDAARGDFDRDMFNALCRAAGTPALTAAPRFGTHALCDATSSGPTWLFDSLDFMPTVGEILWAAGLPDETPRRMKLAFSPALHRAVCDIEGSGLSQRVTFDAITDPLRAELITRLQYMYPAVSENAITRAWPAGAMTVVLGVLRDRVWPFTDKPAGWARSVALLSDATSSRSLFVTRFGPSWNGSFESLVDTARAATCD